MEKVNIKGLEQKQPKIHEFLSRISNKRETESKQAGKNKNRISAELHQQKQKSTDRQKAEKHTIYERRESVSVHQRQIKPARSDTKGVSSNNVNVLFYLNSMPSQPNGEYIDTMHKDWYVDYSKLEREHAYIQWIFPNSFQSRFNHLAKPLSSQQAQEFRTNSQIIRRYIKSYDMMLGFYGFKLIDRKKGVLGRSKVPFHKERFSKTLLTSFHNHMRITRILTSLKETGFSTFALELCKILKYEIYDPEGHMRSLQKYSVYKEWQAIQKSILASPQPKSVYFIDQSSEKVLKEEKPEMKKEQEQEQKNDVAEEDGENLFKQVNPPKQQARVGAAQEKREE